MGDGSTTWPYVFNQCYVPSVRREIESDAGDISVRGPHNARCHDHFSSPRQLTKRHCMHRYRDPVKTIISHGSSDICRRVRHKKDKLVGSTRVCQKLRGSNETAIHEAYVEQDADIFFLKKYFHHYVKPTTPRNYRTVNIKYEALWTNFSGIASALCLPPGAEYVAWLLWHNVMWIRQHANLVTTGMNTKPRTSRRLNV